LFWLRKWNETKLTQHSNTSWKLKIEMLTFVAVSRIRIQWKKLYLFFALFVKQNNFYYLFFPLLLLAFFPLLVRFMFSAFLLLIWTFFLQNESVRLNNKKNISVVCITYYILLDLIECYKFQMRTFSVSDWKQSALNRCQFFWFYLLCMLSCILLDFWQSGRGFASNYFEPIPVEWTERTKRMLSVLKNSKRERNKKL